MSLTESLRNSLPSAVLRTDGTARHLIWPSLIDVSQPGCQNRTKKYGCLRSQPYAVHLQVVLAHPPESLALFQRAPSGRYSDGRIFSFRGANEKFFLLACIGEEVRILHSSKFYFFKNFLSFLIDRTFAHEQRYEIPQFFQHIPSQSYLQKIAPVSELDPQQTMLKLLDTDHPFPFGQRRYSRACLGCQQTRGSSRMRHPGCNHPA